MLDYSNSTESPVRQQIVERNLLASTVLTYMHEHKHQMTGTQVTPDLSTTTDAVSASAFLDVEHELLNQLLTELKWARLYIDHQQMELIAQAVEEAEMLIGSRLFSDKTFPKIRVDENGEFCFIISKQGAYADIGVCGEGELSYHVRNDLTHRSTYGDVKIDPEAFPTDLRDALQSI